MTMTQAERDAIRQRWANHPRVDLMDASLIDALQDILLLLEEADPCATP